MGRGQFHPAELNKTTPGPSKILADSLGPGAPTDHP
jgi:hypothetical protein